MNLKYSKKTIFNYIIGNDLEYDINELENDPTFMIEVLNYTNDTKMYHFCTDKVKSDYDFIRFLLTKFKKDTKFIYEALEFYFSHNDPNSIEYEEILILASILANENTKELWKYKLIATQLYNNILFSIRHTINSFDDKEKKTLGRGFFIIKDNYKNSPIMLKFFAKKYVDDIFNDKHFNLEELLHNNFKKFEHLENYGIYKFLLDYLKYQDEDLALYVGVHLDMLKDIKIKITYLAKRWDKYIKKVEDAKIELTMKKVHELMNPKQMCCRFSELGAICYVARQLGIINKFIDYNRIDFDYLGLYELVDETEKVIYEELKEMDNMKFQFQELSCLENIKQFMTEIFNQRIITIPDSYEEETSIIPQTKTNVLKVSFKK